MARAPFQDTQNGRINILWPTIIIELPRQRAWDFRGRSKLHARKNTASRQCRCPSDNPDPDEVENGVETRRHPRRAINRFVQRRFFSETHKTRDTEMSFSRNPSQSQLKFYFLADLIDNNSWSLDIERKCQQKKSNILTKIILCKLNKILFTYNLFSA